jgi:hypothetical protein
MMTRPTRHALPRLALWGALLAGVAVTCPSPMPGVSAGNWPRSTDLLNLACAGAIALAALRSAELHRSFRGLLIVWIMTLPWIFMEIYALGGTPDPPVQRLLLRWIMCGFSAYVITTMLEEPVLRSLFLSGFLAGVVLSTLSVFYDFLTFTPDQVPVEELVTLAIYDGKDIYDFVYRAYGAFGHPNGAAGCILLGVPVIIGAIQERRWPRWSIALAIALMGTIFYLTKSRGPLAISAGLVAYWLWIETRGIRLPLILAGIVAVLGIFMAGDISGRLDGGVMLERFFDINSISVNAGDRWWTIATSLELILLNPLGMGSAYVAPLDTATGTSATHSAYLELALMGGVPLVILVVVRLAKVAALLFTHRRPVEAWLAAYLLGIFAFESYFLQVSVQLVTLWLVLSPVGSTQRANATEGVALRHPPVDQHTYGRPARREISR